MLFISSITTFIVYKYLYKYCIITCNIDGAITLIAAVLVAFITSVVMMCTICGVGLKHLEPSSNYIVFINPKTTQQLHPGSVSHQHHHQQYQETSAERKTTTSEVKQMEEKIDTNNV